MYFWDNFKEKYLNLNFLEKNFSLKVFRWVEIFLYLLVNFKGKIINLNLKSLI